MEKGCEIIIGGDFNEAFSEGSVLREEFQDIGLQHLNSVYDLSHVRTYKRGRTQLDHIWISDSLIPNTTGFGILPFDYGLESDHRGLYVDIIFKSEPAVQKNSKRTLSSKNEKNVK